MAEISNWYDVFSSFELPRDEAGNIPRSRMKHQPFWAMVENRVPGLSSAMGCYIFALGTASPKPWYVGKTKRSFRGECLNSYQRSIYNDVLARRNGTPRLFFLAKVTERGAFARGDTHHRNIDLLETTLIGALLQRNSELENTHKAGFSRSTSIPGFLNPPVGRLTDEEKALKELIGI